MDEEQKFIASKLLWLDLEMTGLDMINDRILEIAAIVTDLDMKPLAQYEAIIFQDKEILDNMSEWPRQHHGENGLTERVTKEGRPEDQVIQEFADFIKQNFGSEPAVLAGNSIHNDRAFIRLQWPLVEALLFHRMVDVSSFKILMQAKFNIFYPKDKSHRALDDIKLSMSELQYYLNNFSSDDKS